MTAEGTFVASALISATEEGEPTAMWWFCKHGGIAQMTMEECDDPCDDCDCGYAALIKMVEDGG